MGQTTVFGLPFPESDDEPDGATQIQALAERLEVLLADNAKSPGAEVGDLKFSARKFEHDAWIFADGRALIPGAYAELRQMLLDDGSPFGLDSGNPKLPPMVKRVPLGAGTGRAHGSAGGVETVALSAAQMPGHNHAQSAMGLRAQVSGGVTNGTLPDNWPGGDGWVLNGIGVLFTSNPNRWGADVGIANPTTPTATVGGNGAHENMPPYVAGSWFIFAGQLPPDCMTGF